MTPAARRFLRYAAVGVSTFLFDLGMLYVAVSALSIPYYVAVPCSFLVAITANYAASRHFVFKGTEREWKEGYLYFAAAAGIGAAVTTGLTAALIALGLHYLLSRVIVAGIVGTANYLFNLHLNFDMAGKH